jgi:hypothetical protein
LANSVLRPTLSRWSRHRSQRGTCSSRGVAERCQPSRAGPGGNSLHVAPDPIWTGTHTTTANDNAVKQFVKTAQPKTIASPSRFATGLSTASGAASPNANAADSSRSRVSAC